MPSEVVVNGSVQVIEVGTDAYTVVVTQAPVQVVTAASQGPAGATGPGVAAGGTTGQVLAKASDTDFDTHWITGGGGGGSGTVTSVSVATANGVSGSVVNPTTTPAITLALGNITPTSVAATGTVTGSNLSGSNTGDQTITLTGDVTGSGTGSFATTLATVPVAKGGTGQTTAATAINALVPTQTGQANKVLGTDGSVVGWVATTTGTVTSVNLTAPAAGITVSGGPVTSSGSITLALADDLAAVEALVSAGIATRTGANTWTTRTVTGTSNRVTVTNGDGVSGNPTVDISSSYVGQSTITTVGTVTAGTWNGTTIAVANGGTGQTTAANAINALVPSQTGNANKVLGTDGSVVGWVTTNNITTGTTTNLDGYLYGDGANVNAVTPYDTSFGFIPYYRPGIGWTALSTEEASGSVGVFETNGDFNWQPPAGSTIDGTTTTTFNGLLKGDGSGVSAVTTSAGLRSVISDETGTGTVVFNDTPTLITPTLTGVVNVSGSGNGSFSGSNSTTLHVGVGSASVWSSTDLEAVGKVRAANKAELMEGVNGGALRLWDNAGSAWRTIQVTSGDYQFSTGGVNVSGNVTATSFAGDGSAITSIDATNITSGTVPTARLGTGTADSTTYLRGDNTWATPSGGSTSPGGADSTIQYNNGGSFNGAQYLTYDDSSHTLSLTAPSNDIGGKLKVWHGNNTTLILGTSTESWLTDLPQTASSLGSVVRRLEIRASDGSTILGYLPLYDSIT